MKHQHDFDDRSLPKWIMWLVAPHLSTGAAIARGVFIILCATLIPHMLSGFSIPIEIPLAILIVLACFVPLL